MTEREPGGIREESTGRIKLGLRKALERHGQVFAKFFEPIVHATEIDSMEIPSGRKQRILIVEDDQRLLRAYIRGLQLYGYDFEIIGVEGFEDSLRVIENHDYLDVLVLDILLPDGSGIDVAAHALDKWPGIRGVVISGVMSPKIEDKILSMIKPEYRRRWSFHGKPADSVMDAILSAAGTTRTPSGGTPTPSAR